MTLACRSSHRLLALATFLLVAALATPAFAGGRPPGGGCDEPQPRSKAGSSVEGATSSTSSGARRENNLPSQTEDGYLPLSRTAQPSAPSALKPAEPAAAPATARPGAPRAEKPKTARKAEAPAASNRAKKPAPARISIPNLPAQPGMGTLLRVGITAAREIS